jgi:aminoglycoside phosphotransferase (APT) family kinase protein
MADAGTTPEYDDAAIARMRGFVEHVTGGTIVRMDRQVRWRPAWFVDIAREGETIKLHLRGDRTGNVSIFPDLKREADMIAELYDRGIAVPKIHGYCADPPCIVMDALAGTRDFSGLDENERADVGRAYMASVAKMHNLPLDGFIAAGVEKPEGAEDIALVGLNAYLPHYRKTKSRPEPLLEFIIGWLRRNVPKHRTNASFIQFDSGQYLVAEGKVTGLYDFEFSMIGDPMTDIATMGMRNSYEPLGASLADMCRFYEEAGGGPIDHDAVRFHVLVFSTLGAMQFAGTVGEPHPGDPHAVYLEFDLALRRSILLALSAVSGFAIPDVAPLAEREHGPQAVTLRKLADTLAAITPASEVDGAHKAQALQLVEWMARADALGAEIESLNLADVEAYLGRDFADLDAAEAALEDHINSAAPETDEAQFSLLAKLEGRRLQQFGSTAIGSSAQHVVLPQTQ